MIIVAPSQQHTQAQIATDYTQAVRDHDKRQALTFRYSKAISVSNNHRNEFMDELNQLLLNYGL